MPEAITKNPKLRGSLNQSEFVSEELVVLTDLPSINSSSHN